MTDLQAPVSNGAKTVPLYRKLADELETTMGKLGKDSRAPYLKVVKAIEAFPAKEREQVLGDLRKLWDAVGTDGKNDGKLASARKFIDDEWAGR